MPGGIFNPGIHIYNQATVFHRLSSKGVTWKIYYGDVPQTLVMLDQLKYPTHYSRFEEFATDAGGAAANFPQYVFIEPVYFGANQNDQHPPTDVGHGEALICDVYNALRKNEELWSSTLFVLLYDEHGGFYDHVAPPATVAPDGHTSTFSFTQLGIRVPAILISPWVNAGVCSTILDHTSLLKYLTDKWQLGPLGGRVPHSNSFSSLLTQRSSARLDCPQTISAAPAQANAANVALNAQQLALAGFTLHLEANHTQASDAVIANHSRAMVADFNSQSKVVSERVEQYFASARAKAAVSQPRVGQVKTSTAEGPA
jgi:phospholipase C